MLGFGKRSDKVAAKFDVTLMLSSETNGQSFFRARHIAVYADSAVVCDATPAFTHSPTTVRCSYTIPQVLQNVKHMPSRVMAGHWHIPKTAQAGRHHPSMIRQSSRVSLSLVSNNILLYAAQAQLLTSTQRPKKSRKICGSLASCLSLLSC